MSGRQDLLEELDELRRKAQIIKTQLIEIKTKGTDPLQSYAKEMPPDLSSAQAWGHDVLVWGVTDPVHPGLAIAAILFLYAVEGVMSRWLALPEVLHDRMREPDYRALSSSDPRLRDAFTSVDTSGMEAENE